MRGAAELRRFEMGDPLHILISREGAARNRSCAGCINARAVQDPFGGTQQRCMKGRPYGKKCKKYEVENV